MKFLILVFCLALSTCTKAQTTAHQDCELDDAIALKDSEDFSNSLLAFENANADFLKSGKFECLLRSMQLVVELYWNHGLPQKSDSVLKEAFLIADTQVTNEEDYLYDLYYKLGIVDIMLSRYDSAKVHFQKSIDLIETDALVDKETEINAHFNKGASFYYVGELDSAILCFEKSLAKRIEDHKSRGLDTVSAEFIQYYINMGAVYTQMNNHRKAFENYQKGQTIAMEVENIDPAHEALLYLNIGLGYSKKGAYYESKKNILKSLELLEANDVLFTPLNEGSLLVAAETFVRSGNFETADSLIQIFLDTTDEKVEHVKVAQAAFNQGYLYYFQQDHHKAIPHFERARRLFESYEPNSRFLPFTYINLLLSYFAIENDEDALLLLEKTKNLVSESYGTHHSAWFNIQLVLAQYHIRNNRFAEAISILTPAIGQNEIYKSESLSGDFFSPWDQVNMLHVLAVSYQETDPKQALKTYYEIDDAVNSIRTSYLDFQDRVAVSDSINLAYDDAIAFLIDNLNKPTESRVEPESSLNDLMFFSERSKSFNLLLSVWQREMASLGKSSFLVTKIGQTQADINYQLGELSLAIHSKDSLNIKGLRDKIRKINTVKDSYISQLKADFELEFNILFNQKITSLDAVKNALSPDELGISFLRSKEAVYALIISTSDFKGIKLGATKDIDRLVERFLRNFNLQSAKVSDLENYKKSSSDLYDMVLEPILSGRMKSQLLIIPDETFYYIPFEALITDTSGNDFRSLSYLLNDVEVRYAQSFSLLDEVSSSNSKKRGLLAASPEFHQDEFSLDEIPLAERASLSPIPYSQKEVLSISKIVTTELMLGDFANEKSLTTKAPKYSIIHLAAHGLVNSEEPLKSKLILERSKEDPTSDGLLHLYEVLELNLDAEMVVLSACNTGVGKINRGEGTMSIASSFFYSGARSVVMSLWPANDQSTSQIMTSFYQNLSDGNTRSAALRTAKLQYLSSAPKLASHPYFWSQFVLYGKNERIDMKGDFLLETVLGIIGLLVLIFFVSQLLKKKRSGAESN